MLASEQCCCHEHGCDQGGYKLRKSALPDKIQWDDKLLCSGCVHHRDRKADVGEHLRVRTSKARARGVVAAVILPHCLASYRVIGREKWQLQSPKRT
jgi:hypothetical protein